MSLEVKNSDVLIKITNKKEMRLRVVGLCALWVTEGVNEAKDFFWWELRVTEGGKFF